VSNPVLRLLLLQLLAERENEKTLLQRLKRSISMTGRRKRRGYDGFGEENSFYGRKHTPETKARMSAAKKGERNPNYGKPLKPKHRDRIATSCRATKRAKKEAESK
jgi:hypothetical protein